MKESKYCSTTDADRYRTDGNDQDDRPAKNNGCLTASGRRLSAAVSSSPCLSDLPTGSIAQVSSFLAAPWRCLRFIINFRQEDTTSRREGGTRPDANCELADAVNLIYAETEKTKDTEPTNLFLSDDSKRKYGYVGLYVAMGMSTLSSIGREWKPTTDKILFYSSKLSLRIDASGRLYSS
eukprot:scaffold6862_cov92-Skeletonema_dohrnii-CCMP3373.AAC.3